MPLEENGTMREMGGSRYGVFDDAIMDEVVRTAWVCERQIAGMAAGDGG